MPTSSKRSLSFQFPKKLLYTHVPLPHPSPSPWHDQPNNVCKVQIMKLLSTLLLLPPSITQILLSFSALCCLTLPANVWSSPAVRDQVSHSYRHQLLHQLHHTQFWVVRAVSTVNGNRFDNTCPTDQLWSAISILSNGVTPWKRR